MPYLKKLVFSTAAVLTLSVSLVSCSSTLTASPVKPSSPTATFTPVPSPPQPLILPSASPVAAPSSQTPEQEIATTMTKFLNGPFQVTPATARKIQTLNKGYAKMNKAQYVKQIEQYVPSMKLAHTAESKVDFLAEIDNILTSAVTPETLAAYKATPAKVDPNKVLIYDATHAVVPADAVSTTSKEVNATEKGMPFIKTKSGWRIWL